MAAPAIRGATAVAAGLSSTSPAGTQVGDMVIVFTWERAGAGIPDHTVDTGGGYVEIRSHAHNDGSTDGRLSVGYKIATSGGAVSYQAFTSSVGTETWSGILVLDVGTFDTAIVSTSVTLTTNGLPNPPAIAGLASLQDYLIIAVSAWHLTASQTNTITAPTNYTLQSSIAGAATGELGIATRDISALSVSSEDPGTFGDNQAPNGSCSMTIAVCEPLTFGMLRQASSTSVGADTSHAFPINVKQGNLLVCCVDGNFGDLVAPTDSQGNTWAIAQTGNDIIFQITLAYAIAGATGACTVTPNVTGAANSYQMIGEYEGPYDPSPLDDTAADFATSANASSGNVTPTVDGCVLVGHIYGVNDLTVAGGWSLDNTATGFSDSQILSHAIQTTAVADAAEATLTSGQWIAVAAAFKPLAGAAAFVLTATGGTYGITGTSTPIRFNRLLGATGGTYSVAGTNASLNFVRKILAQAGAYGIAGGDVEALVDRVLHANPGAYVITGVPADLEWSGEGGGTGTPVKCVFIPTFRTRRGR